MDTPVSVEDPAKLRAALLRAMPMSRMLDYGMDHGDAVHLANAAVSEPWHEVATRLAEAQSTRAEATADRGDVETAVACYRRATASLIFAQMAFNTDHPAKRALYVRLTRAYQAAAELDTESRVERLSIPFRQSHCTAWFVSRSGARPGPTVVIVGGQSGWGPAFHQQAEALVRRGLSAVLLETPGQGDTRMAGGLHLDGTVDRAFSAALDAVRARTGYDGRYGVWGNSFGGLLAARAAVHDSRFGACCVNGATAKPEPLPFRTAREQSRALLGVDTDEAAAAVFRTLWLDPAVDHTSAAMLVLHGGNDPLVSLDQQKVFLDLSAHPTLRVWDDGDHTMYNHSAERTEFVCDWFRAQLCRG
ncbi:MULTISPECIES: alpha/beta fold hydrolase [unclassified Streptomyces]|uniref:alpha/beta hydrolase n=1 Tax=unclassified Streptomyces TaxID=2593676 RepID=UPI002DD7D40C|nr:MULTISPECIES: alpha/beta fold hydrolase [unclassified Streptomyces]WSB80274.1 alpha/beta hydrolase [Streptomyces sp. NBC_01775]WSS11516.1 alpha/beta hydrolase [Streptomyces sp. NBC_01186]WSS40231.1 alpha/beta hydrolase [Streptomyces sp. NBC_01187]